MSFYNETVSNLQAMYNQQQMNQMYGQGPNYYDVYINTLNLYNKQRDLNADLIVKNEKLKEKLNKIKAALAARQKAREEIIGELEGI